MMAANEVIKQRLIAKLWDSVTTGKAGNNKQLTGVED